jgi:hypothetical protein
MKKGIFFRSAILTLLFANLIVTGCNSVKDTFNKEVSKNIIQQGGIKKPVITEDDLKGLPLPVQRHLRYAKIIGRERTQSVRLKFEGTFKMGPDKPWIPVSVIQYSRLDTPYRYFYITGSMYRLFTIKGRDKYENGKGNMLIKLFGLFTVADAWSKEMDQSAVVTFLDDMAIVPSAMLSSYISWQPIDSLSAKATITDHGNIASAVFYFDKKGELVNICTDDRYYSTSGNEYKKIPWCTPFAMQRDSAGGIINSVGEAIWKLDTGDFKYARFVLTDIDYNVPCLYDDCP